MNTTDSKNNNDLANALTTGHPAGVTSTNQAQQGKYSPTTLLPALRLFIKARNEAIAAGFTDNGGAIHSVERILDTLCQRVKYPNLRHINKIKEDPDAECSLGAYKARQRGEKVLIEHLMPQRAFAKEVIQIVGKGATDDDILAFIRQHYRLVLLTQEETTGLNRLNRSCITPDRLADVGIMIFRATTPTPPSVINTDGRGHDASGPLRSAEDGKL